MSLETDTEKLYHKFVKGAIGYHTFVKEKMSKIGDRLRELRGPSSLREMAEPVGIKYNAWARYEAGDSLPGAEIIEKICRAHAVSADWLLGLKDNGTTVTAAAGSAVAIGSNARATAITNPGTNPACAKCPHLKKLKKLEAVLSGR